MASDSQKKILGLVRALIEKHGFEPVTRTAWDNTGAVGIEHPGAFGELAHIAYDFQDGYFTLTIRVQGAKDSRHYLRYDEVGKWTMFTVHLTQLLKVLKPGNQEAAS